MRSLRSGRRATASRVLSALTLVLATFALIPLAVPPAGAEDPGVLMRYFRSIGVDPSSGRVFMAGDDLLRVFQPDGALLATLDVPGAGGLEFDGGSLWVTETTVGRIAEVDLTALAVVREVPVGLTISRTSLAKIGSVLWFVGDGQLQRFDLVTGTRTAKGPAVDFVELPWSPNELLLWSSNDWSGRIDKVDTSTTPATVKGTQIAGATLGQLVVDPIRRTFVHARGLPTSLVEVSPATMERTGLVYPLQAIPTSIARSGDGRTMATSSAEILEVGVPGPPLPPGGLTYSLNRSVALSNDGTRVYSVMGDTGYGIKSLRTVELTPTVTALSPKEVIAHLPGTSLKIDGSRLGMATKVTVGGIDVPFTFEASSLRVTVPVGLEAGSRAVTVTTRLGSASAALTVLPNTGAVLRGSVKTQGAATTGTVLRLRGSALTAPLTATSGADGTYSFTGLPYGTDYVLTAHDPTGAFPDQQAGVFSLVPNSTVTRDVTFVRPVPGSGARVATAVSPVGDPADAVFDPMTQRLFVSGAGGVVVFDRDGFVVGRIFGFGSVGRFALDGDDLYAAAAGAIVRIDPQAMLVTATWPLAPSPSDVVFVGGRLWFASSGVLGSLDPATGAVSTSTLSFPSARLRALDGATDRFYLWSASATSSAFGAIVKVAGSEATVSAQRFGLGEATGSVVLDRLWDAGGRELRVSDLQLTGVTYPSTSSLRPVLSRSPRGLLVAFGPTIVRITSLIPTHLLAVSPYLSTAPQSFDAAGDRFFQLDRTNLIIWDLRAHLTSASNVLNPTPSSTIEVRGDGLGSTTTARIDGVPAAVSNVGPTSVRVAAGGLAPGTHTVEVTTAWGVSTPTTFSVVPTPAITAIVPSWVPTTGGAVTISGTGFTYTSRIEVGGLSVPFQVLNDATITAQVPAHASGTATVVVHGWYYHSTTSPLFGWGGPPTVTALDLASGPASGGFDTTLRGAQFTGATGVRFGTVTLYTFTVVDDETIVVRVPAGTVGSVDVTVTNAFGTSLQQVPFSYRLGPRFSDVPVGAPFFVDIEWAAERGITTGFPDGTFRPAGPTDRQAMAALLYRAAGSPLGPDPACSVSPFTDVPVSNPFCGEIAWLKDARISSGDADGTFRPLAPVSRQAMAAFLYRFIGAPPGAQPTCDGAPFDDVSATAPFCGEIDHLKSLAITSGFPDGTFRPTADVARAATVAFLHRIDGLR